MAAEQKVFTDPTGFTIKIQTGTLANAVVDNLADNYMRANCKIAWSSKGGFHAWNPPSPDILGTRDDTVNGIAYYINESDRAYLESLEQLKSE